MTEEHQQYARVFARWRYFGIPAFIVGVLLSFIALNSAYVLVLEKVAPGASMGPVNPHLSIICVLSLPLALLFLAYAFTLYRRKEKAEKQGA